MIGGLEDRKVRRLGKPTSTTCLQRLLQRLEERAKAVDAGQEWPWGATLGAGLSLSTLSLAD